MSVDGGAGSPGGETSGSTREAGARADAIPARDAAAGEPAEAAPVIAGIDATKPSIARVYDALLSGKDNYAADRELAERIITLNPGLPGLVRDNRAFIIKAVTWAASHRGIRQFVDLGAGLPTHPSVHEAARKASPDARVAYVDNDPMVQRHVQALLAGDGVVAAGADITRPADVLADPELARVIDLGQPVGVILAAVLHFQPAEVARSLIAEYAAPLAAGSVLIVSVFSAIDEKFSEDATRAYTAGQWHSHSPAEVERWLREAGLRPLRGHVGNVSAWPLDSPPRAGSMAEAIGDLAEKLLQRVAPARSGCECRRLVPGCPQGSSPGRGRRCRRLRSRCRPAGIPRAAVRSWTGPGLAGPVNAPAAAWYFATTSAGTRPRSLISTPLSRAQARTAVVSAELGRRPAPRPAGRVPLAVTLRAWLTYLPSALRSSASCAVLRSISYSAPSRPKRTVPSASPPSMSSMKSVWIFWAMVLHSVGGSNSLA
jgi:O-methyltransferase involved in polyketide biosynthesis